MEFKCRPYTEEYKAELDAAREGAIKRSMLIAADDEVHIRILQKTGFSWVDTGIGVVVGAGAKHICDGIGRELVVSEVGAPITTLADLKYFVHNHDCSGVKCTDCEMCTGTDILHLSGCTCVVNEIREIVAGM